MNLLMHTCFTKQKATERSRIVESSREPSNVYESDRLSKTDTNIHNKQQNYTPLQDSTNRQKSLSVYDYATPVSEMATIYSTCG